MARIHPFPGVRIAPVGYRRYMVIQTIETIQTGEVYARNQHGAQELAREGRISNLAIADQHNTCIVIPHPDDTEWKEQDNEQDDHRDATRTDAADHGPRIANGYSVPAPDEA